MILNRHLTEQELHDQEEDLEHVIEEINKDTHDNCDMNKCRACAGLEPGE